MTPDPTVRDAGPATVPAPSAGTSHPRARLWFWVRLAVALGLVAVLLRTVDFRRAFETVARADLGLFLLVFPVGLADRFIMSFKWNLLLRARDRGFPTLEAFRIYLAATFVGYWLPTGVGADVFRAVRGSMSGRGVSDVSATIILERALGMLAMITLSVIGLGLLLANGDTRVRGPLVLATVLFAAAVGGLAFSIQPGLFAWLRRITARHATKRPVRIVLSLHDAYVELSRHRGAIVAFFLLSLVEQVIQVTMMILLARAVHLQASLLQYFGLLPISNVLVTLPISVASIGVMEGTYILALARAGVTADGALSLTLLNRASTLLMLVPCGLAFLWDSATLRRRGGGASRPGVGEKP